MIGIYKITNPSGKVYVGQAIDLERRKQEYRGVYCKSQPRLYSSLLKYGFCEHIFEVIEECEVIDLNTRERHWQDFYDVLGKDGLNCRLTESGDRQGVMSAESRQRMSQSKLGKKQSKEVIEKRVKSRKGYTHSEETKQKISQSNIGKVLSEDIIVSRRGRKASDETRQKMSLAKIGRRIPKDVIDRRVESRKGYKHSQETIDKIQKNRKINKE